ncbi:MAG: hypothetical protein ABI369_08370 [Acetobacteraceae bacterium]
MGAVIVNTVPALADMPVIDVTEIAKTIQQSSILSAIQTIMTTISSTENDIKTFANDIFGAIGDNTFGSVQQLLQEGFTQQANYVKAQTGAMQQIADASNLANAQFQLQVRDAQIRDDHTVSPTACAALDGGVSTISAGVQGYDVAWTIANIHNARGQAQPGMPSYYGQAQGVASMAREHLSNYCDQKDVDAGLCPAVSPTPDGDSEYSTYYGAGTYANQPAINAAKDYAINLIEPVAPAALRGDQLRSITGQNAAVRRRSYDARISLAQSVVDQQIGMQAPAVPITQAQQQYLTSMGLPVAANGAISWFQALQIEAERRVSDVNWAATLQADPPAAVEREIAVELALSDYIAFQNFKLGLQREAIGAAHLAHDVDHDFMPTSQMPTPTIAAN